MARLVWNGGAAIRKLEKETPGLTRRIAEIIATAARQLCPVDTGNLRDSIRVTDNSVNVDAHYASYVELGTPRAAAQPFLKPAIEMFKNSGMLEALRGIKVFRGKSGRRPVKSRISRGGIGEDLVVRAIKKVVKSTIR